MTTLPAQKPATTVSVDVADLIRVLQVQIPQLHNETVVYAKEHKAQMEDTREQYRLLCKETDHLRKKLLAVIQDNNNYRKAQERMESQIYAQQQELAQAHKDTQTLTRQRKGVEKRLENELQNYESDRLLWQQREADLCGEIKRWSIQDRTGHQPRRTRSATASNIWANRPSTSLPEPQSWRSCSDMGPLFEERTKSIDSVAARDTKIRAQDKLISDFKSEVEQQKRVIHEAMLTAEAQTQRVNTLEQELASLKEVNASLMEDNESYQILLHEKTMAGEFPKKSDLAAAAKPQTASLAAELNKVQGGDCSCQQVATVKKLSDEVRVLQESNKALSLYMNKILLKIVDNQELVDVLNIDEDDEQSIAQSTAAPPKPADPSVSEKTASRPRRSTISSWMSSPKQPVPMEQATMGGRHRSHTNNDGGSQHHGGSGGGGGWSRALKRMTVIGWSSSKEHGSSAAPITPASHDSAISSCDSVILEE